MDHNPYQGDPNNQNPPQNPYAGTQPPYQQPPPQPGARGGPGFQPTAAYPGAPYAQPVHDPRGGVALAGFIIGLVGLFAWCIAICGVVIAIPGLVLSIMGLSSTRRRGFAIAGVILNSVALLLSILNAILGIIMAASGNQHPWGP